MTHYCRTNNITFGCAEYTCKHRDNCAAATNQKRGKYAERDDCKWLLKPHLYLTFVERRWGKTHYKVGCREYQEKKQ